MEVCPGKSKAWSKSNFNDFAAECHLQLSVSDKSHDLWVKLCEVYQAGWARIKVLKAAGSQRARALWRRLRHWRGAPAWWVGSGGSVVAWRIRREFGMGEWKREGGEPATQQPWWEGRMEQAGKEQKNRRREGRCRGECHSNAHVYSTHRAPSTLRLPLKIHTNFRIIWVWFW